MSNGDGEEVHIGRRTDLELYQINQERDQRAFVPQVGLHGGLRGFAWR